MATIKDIAKLSGYSVSTVSRVLNNERNVGKEISEKILESAKILNYQPNILGRNLRNKDSKIIMCVMRSVNTNFIVDSFVSIQERLLQDGYRAILCPLNNDSAIEKQTIELLEGHLASGVIFMGGTTLNESELSELNKRFPMVQCSEYVPAARASYVSIDNRMAAIDGVNYLIENGHSRIGMVSCDTDIISVTLREAGYREALASAGIELDEAIIKRGDFTFESGYSATMDLISLPNPPEAYFCLSDSMACGCIRALYDSGIRVPEDVSVLGFDNSIFSRNMIPAITTIGTPLARMGTKAAELILQQLKTSEKTNEAVLLPHELVIRESVKTR